MDFAELADKVDDRSVVLLGASLIARDERPDLEPAQVARELDALAAPLGSLRGRSPAEQAEVLAWHLHHICGFYGNREDYYDPRNSYINDVLERRTGIPITLSLVFIEIAHRAGAQAAGVGFPGHFLVRIGDDVPVVIDPFHGGSLLTRRELEELLHRTTDGAMPFDEALLKPISNVGFLVRMLLNLRSIYATRRDFPRLMVVLSRLLELQPGAAQQWRERGLLAAHLGAPHAAISDLGRYVEIAPEAGDAPEIRAMIDALAASSHPQN